MRAGVRTPWARWVPCLLVAALASACAAAPLEVPTRTASAAPTLPAATAAGEPSGTVTVAYPEEPSAFLRPGGAEVASDDLAALWGLPLLRVDDAGQFRRGLVEDWEVLGSGPDGWRVRLDLRAGEWTDGTAVDATDVVATLQARRSADRARFGILRSVSAPDDRTVVLVFRRPYASWADLLVEVGTVLSSEEVEGGLDEIRGEVPVSGGWFRLVDREPGLRVVFAAHPDGPLGPPGVDRIEVLFTPSYDTALGLLEDDRVDLLVGYLPLNGVSRANEVDGVTAASPLGGTLVALQYRPGGRLGAEDLAARRRGVAESADVTELVEGLLGANGERARTPWPGVDLPADPPAGEVREGQEFVLLFPRGSGVLGFTARAMQRDLTSRGMTVDLVGEAAPRFAEVVDEQRDLALVVRRSSPRPSLSPWVDDVRTARAAGAARPGAPAAEDGLAAVAATARIAPLFRIGVLHAWRDVDGIRPSAWVGAGFWNAGAWTIDGDE